MSGDWLKLALLVYLTQIFFWFHGALMHLPNLQGSFSDNGQAKHTVLLSYCISHIDYQASYTPDTLCKSRAMDSLIM